MTKQKKRILIIAIAFIIGLFLILFVFFIFNIAIQKNINQYKENQTILAHTLLSNAVDQTNNNNQDLTDTLATSILNNFPTSSSVFCIITKNDKITFYKDKNTTSTLIDDNINNYFKNDISLSNNQAYIISKSEIQQQNDKYTLLLCTKQVYYLKKLQLSESRLYCIGFIILYSSFLIILLFFSFYQIRTEEKSNDNLKKEITKNRKLIELLENDKIKNYVNSDKEYSFYNRSIVDEVIKNMTPEEKAKCYQIDIIIENLKMEHFIFITAILGRIKGANSIACFWESNQFKVLLLNSSKEEVIKFTNLFISKYKSESEEKVEELKVVANKLNI